MLRAGIVGLGTHAPHAIANQHVHLRGDLCHAVPHLGANHWHVPQGIGAYSLK
jgi:hypothetical protein